MTATNSLTVVWAWLVAVNHEAVPHLRDLSDPGIEVMGPRGSGRGTTCTKIGSAGQV
jgi:hypothetical protein